MQYAAARAGVILVNVNPAYRSHELRYVLQQVAHPRPVPARERSARQLPRDSGRIAQWRARCRWNTSSGWATNRGTHDRRRSRFTPSATPAGRRRQHPVHFRHHRIAQGRHAHAPQPAQQRHGDRRWRCRPRETDRICAPVPLYHCFGSVIGSMVSRRERRGADSALRAVRRAGDARSRPPRARHRALRRPDHVHGGNGAPRVRRASILSSLRKGVMSGAPCPIELMKRVAERMHMRAK